MTNEEIEREVLKVIVPKVAPVTSPEGVVTLKTADLKSLAELCARALVSQAYEEAAQIADQCAAEAGEWAARESLPPDHGGDPEIAARIRALKDSLAQEPVSSAS